MRGFTLLGIFFVLLMTGDETTAASSQYTSYPSQDYGQQLNTAANTDGQVQFKYFLSSSNGNPPRIGPTDSSFKAVAITEESAKKLYPHTGSIYSKRGQFQIAEFGSGKYKTNVKLTTSTSAQRQDNVVSDEKNDNKGNAYDAAVEGSVGNGPQPKTYNANYYYYYKPDRYRYSSAERGIRQPGQWNSDDPQKWRRMAGEEIVEISNRALLEEADSDATGQTHCLDVPRCSYVPIRKECRGHEQSRTSDGTCNNLHRPLWGSAFQPFQRYLKPCYQDGVETPRSLSTHVHSKGRSPPLPSPRLVSRTVHLLQDVTSHVSGLLMQFGQFVDHDITGTSSTIGRKFWCHNLLWSESSKNKCLPILIPPGDTHFRESTCINFVRSLPFTDPQNNTQAPREQRNEVTSFLDASVVYGSAEDQTSQLRSFKKGLLKYSEGEMLPLESGGCAASDGLCLLSGDTRVNEVPGLGVLHLLFHRQHNRLAHGLLSLLQGTEHLYPQQALDEAIFQTVRKILAAQFQHITYTQWLPLVLGPFTVSHYGLNQGTPFKYDSTRDPRIANVFATAAFRFGHTLVPDSVLFGDEVIPLHRAFNNPSWIRQDMDKLLTGLLQVPAQARDQFFASGLRNRLFEAIPRKGLDLVALNIQRGRDHGLPPYMAWRATCGLPRLHGFNDSALGTAGPALREVYLTLADIDLFSGAVSEPALAGGLVGPTLACLIGRQFADLKFADRFFYETTGPEGFTKDQLQYIYKTTMAGLICSNTHIMSSIQRNPFIARSKLNPMVACSELKQTASLEPWRQEMVNLILTLLSRQ